MTPVQIHDLNKSADKYRPETKARSMTRATQPTTTDDDSRPAQLQGGGSGREHALQEILQLQRGAFHRDGIPSVAVRQDRVARLQALIIDNTPQLAEALRLDFGSRPAELSFATDLVSSVKALQHDRTHIARWSRPTRFGNLVTRMGLEGEVRPVPKGVVGVIGPWNFPLNLVVLPAGAALAAGNRVMIRPSEIAAETTAMFARLASEYFDLDELAVITDVHGNGADFAALPFDHVFFTGSPQVGALVAEAAGRNLVPTTLELGGKNPVIVDRSAPIERAARRIAASRLVNGGQVCLSPDYVYVPVEHLARFADVVLQEWSARYPRIVGNPEYTAIINERNFDRILGLVEDALAKGAAARSAAPAGEFLPDRNSRKIAPTLLTGVTSEMRAFHEEIFGPLLSIYPYADLAEPIAHIGGGESPLTLYWYGKRNARFHRLLAETRSGSVNVNDFAVNLAHAELPFGGVGHSGSGYYHGKYGFDTFSHHRAIATSQLPMSVAGLLNAPYMASGKHLSTVQLASLRRSVRRALGKQGARRPGKRAVPSSQRDTD